MSDSVKYLTKRYAAYLSKFDHAARDIQWMSRQDSVRDVIEKACLSRIRLFALFIGMSEAVKAFDDINIPARKRYNDVWKPAWNASRIRERESIDNGTYMTIRSDEFLATIWSADILYKAETDNAEKQLRASVLHALEGELSQLMKTDS